MIEPLVLPTQREGVIVRQFSTEADDIVYFESYNASRPEIAQFDPGADTKHRTLEDTRKARLEAGDKLRMGVWDADTFVGSANATPDEQGVEIGYWIDSRHTGHGYATLAARAISSYVAERFPRVHAAIDVRNEASAHVLENAGFRPTILRAGQLFFERPHSPVAGRIGLSETEPFERPGFSGHVYVPKQAGVGLVALQVNVHGQHPQKRILDGNTRYYRVESGRGTFVVGDTSHDVQAGDLFVLPAGTEYSYSGAMKLFEFNVSPDNSFGDEVVPVASSEPFRLNETTLRRSDFHEAYSPIRVWSGLYRLACNIPEFPLRPSKESKFELSGDIDAALAWIDEFRPTSRQAVFYDLLRRIAKERRRIDDTHSKD